MIAKFRRFIPSLAAASLAAAAIVVFTVGAGSREIDGNGPAPGETNSPESGTQETLTIALGHIMERMPGTRNLRLPDMNAARGKKLFVSKGCVSCHSVNGVGGHDATPLDAHTMQPMMNPFELAAKMWRMAPFMIAAQEEALGGQILFSGDELADIIAFVHDDVEQHTLNKADITPEVMKMMNHAHGAPRVKPAAHAEQAGHRADESKDYGH